MNEQALLVAIGSFGLVSRDGAAVVLLLASQGTIRADFCSYCVRSYSHQQ